MNKTILSPAATFILLEGRAMYVVKWLKPTSQQYSPQYSTVQYSPQYCTALYSTERQENRVQVNTLFNGYSTALSSAGFLSCTYC